MRKYKTPEAEARARAHQFGQPGGNTAGDQRVAGSMRAFYRWVESEATEEELTAYVNDPTKPYVRRKFVTAMTAAATPQDFFDLTNQTHGAPKQVIETVDAPTIVIDLGDDDFEVIEEKPKRKRGRKPKAKK